MGDLSYSLEAKALTKHVDHKRKVQMKNDKPKKNALLSVTKGTHEMEYTADTINISFEILNTDGQPEEYSIKLVPTHPPECDDTFIILSCGDGIARDVAIALAKKILEVAKIK